MNEIQFSEDKFKCSRELWKSNLEQATTSSISDDLKYIWKPEF